MIYSRQELRAMAKTVLRCREANSADSRVQLLVMRLCLALGIGQVEVERKIKELAE